MAHTVHMSHGIPTPLADASGYEMIDWAMRVRRTCPQPKTIRCTVEQAETLAAMSGGLVPKIRFGMVASVLGLPIEWVTDPAESTIYAGRAMAAMSAAGRPNRTARRHTENPCDPTELIC